MTLDLQNASREQLLQLISQLLDQVQLLQQRVLQLEAEVASSRGDGPKTPPPSFVKANRKKNNKKTKRKPRSRGFARKLDAVTLRRQHALDHCPDCLLPLTGHRLIKKRRLIELPLARAQVVEHQFIERTCPGCHKGWHPEVDFSALAIGQQRFGISVLVEVALLRQQCRLPFRLIQDYLRQRFGLHISVGQLVAMVGEVARLGKTLVEQWRQQIRGSPVVYADETSWRENGQNGYVWSFSTEQLRYFIYRQSRSAEVVKEVLGESFGGVLVSDFYAAYNAHLGQHQRCWVHLLRDIHEEKEKHSKDRSLRWWAGAVKRIYERAKAYEGASEQEAQRVQKQRAYEQELLKACRPYVKKGRVQSRLCERIERFLGEMFAFVRDGRVSSDNNAAERSVREVVVNRKISGGTRSREGSEAKMILASLLGTWKLQGKDFYQGCWDLLTTNNSTL